MKILQLTKKFPFPPHDGEVLAINALTNSLSDKGHQLTVLALNTKKHFVDLASVPQDFLSKAEYHSVKIDTSVKLVPAFLNLFKPNESYNVKRFYSKEYEEKLKETLQKETFEIVQMEGFYLAQYIPLIRKYSTAKVVMRAHNVEFEIWERLAGSTSNPLKKRWFELLASRMRTQEILSLNSYDALVPITEKDAAFFVEMGCSVPIKVIPTGIFISEKEVEKTSVEPNSIFHLGAMDWLPNIEGVEWFLKEVWGKLHQELPQTTLYLAGRNMSPEFKKRSIKGVEIIGEVADAKEFMRSKDLMIVPLLSGSGMRIKIIEALSIGKSIISTSVGAEGIAVTDGKDMLIADDVQTFINKVKNYFENRTLADSLSQNAKSLIKEYYDNRVLATELSVFYSNL